MRSEDGAQSRGRGSLPASPGPPPRGAAARRGARTLAAADSSPPRARPRRVFGSGRSRRGMVRMARTPVGRSGKVLCHRSGERWTVELRLEESGGSQGRLYRVVLGRTFTTEIAASQAGEQVVTEWQGNRIAVRDLMLGELAATYRRLRETYQRTEPSVPTAAVREKSSGQDDAGTTPPTPSPP